jgi:hypothetical protein
MALAVSLVRCARMARLEGSGQRGTRQDGATGAAGAATPATSVGLRIFVRSQRTTSWAGRQKQGKEKGGHVKSWLLRNSQSILSSVRHATANSDV